MVAGAPCERKTNGSKSSLQGLFRFAEFSQGVAENDYCFDCRVFDYVELDLYCLVALLRIDNLAKISTIK